MTVPPCLFHMGIKGDALWSYSGFLDAWANSLILSRTGDSPVHLSGTDITCGMFKKGGIHVSGVGEGYGGYGYGSSVGAILVLFILLVIITRAFI